MNRPALRARCWRVLSLVLLWPATVPAAHPLITEDTGTQGSGHLQLELTNEHATVKQDGLRQTSVLSTAILAIGVRDDTDVLVSLPHLRISDAPADGTPGPHGLADLGLDVKWRFYESGPLSLALKPGLTFPTGDDRRGLGVGKTTWSAYLVTSVDVRPWTFHLHLGHVHHNNTFNERVDIWHASAAVVRQVGESLKLIADGGIDTHTDPAVDSGPLFLILGAIWSPRPDFDLDFGIKSERSDVHRGRTWLAGLTWRR